MTSSTISISTGTGIDGSNRTSDCRTQTGTWAGFCEAIQQVAPSKHAWFVSPGLQPVQPPPGKATNRQQDTGHCAHIVGVDIDGRPTAPIHEALDALEAAGLEFFCFTSWSHRKKSLPGESRVRVFFRLETPAKDNAAYHAHWSWLRAHFADHGVEIDPAGGPSINSVFYIGVPPEGHPDEREDGQPRWTRSNSGVGLGINHQLHSLPKPKQSRTPRPTSVALPGIKEATPVPLADRLEALKAALDKHGPAVEGAGGDLHTFRVGGLLSLCALTPDEAWAEVQAWNSTCRPSWDEVSLRDKVTRGFNGSTLPWGSAVAHLVPAAPPVDDEGVMTIESPAEGYLLNGVSLADFRARVGAKVNTQVLVILDSPTGTGKSTLVRSWLSEVTKRLVVTDSIALAQSLASKYGMPSYQDTHDRAATEVVTTIHSLHHYAPFVPYEVDLTEDDPIIPKRWDIAFCDEAPAVREAVHGGLVVDGQAAKELLLDHLCAARTGIVASADIGPEVSWWVEAFRARCPDAQIVYVRQPVVQGRKAVRLAETRALLREHLDYLVQGQRVGDAPIIYASASTKRPQEFAAEVAAKRPDLRVFWISSENSQDPEIRAILSHPDFLANYDVIAHSPSIRSGLSWDAPVGAVVVEVDRVPDFTSESICQMIDRARQATEVHLYVSKSNAKIDVTPTAIAHEALALARATTKAVAGGLRIRSGEVKPMDPEYFASWVIQETKCRRARADSIGDFRRTALRYGWTVQDWVDTVDPEEAKRISAAARVAKQAVEETRREEILAAERITEDTAAELAAQHTLTAPERAALIRHRMERFYAANVTGELYDRDKNRKTRKHIRQGVEVDLLQRGTDVARLREQRQVERGDQPSDLRHRHLQAKLLARITQALLGCSMAGIPTDLELHPDLLVERATSLLSDPVVLRASRRLLRTNIHSLDPKTVMAWAVAQLRRVGLDVSIKRRRTAEGRVQFRSISRSTLDQLGAAEYRRAEIEWAEHAGLPVPAPLLPPPLNEFDTSAHEALMDEILKSLAAA